MQCEGKDLLKLSITRLQLRILNMSQANVTCIGKCEVCNKYPCQPKGRFDWVFTVLAYMVLVVVITLDWMARENE